MITRRQLIARTACAAASLAGPGLVSPSFAQSVSESKLMEEGPLAEMAIGDPDAPVTVVEYASMTCGHCRTFHKQTYPTIREEYVETGKVRFIMREFPLDNVATAVFMIARCAPEEQYFDVVDLFFETQRTWVASDNIVGELFNISRQMGFTQDEFESCLTNQELLDGINAVKATAARDFGVSSTPTFFINGDMVRGVLTVDQMREEIERRL